MSICATVPHLPITHVGSKFGERLGRTGLRTTFHAGWDIVGRTGDPIYSPVDGVVTHVQPNDPNPASGPFSGYGRVVVINEPLSGASLFFAHQSRTNVVVGQQVHKGQVIGFIGNANNGRFPGMGAHLHFEIRRNPLSKTSAQNPERWLGYLGWNLTQSNDVLLANDCSHSTHSGGGASKQIGPPPPLQQDVPGGVSEEYEPPFDTNSSKVPLILGGVGVLVLVGLGFSLLVHLGKKR